MSKRAYRSVARAESALATRTEILRAAEALFAEQGYAQTTVAGIAERAQVATNTVYTSVGGKSALIDAIVQDSTADAIIDAALSGILAETPAGRDEFFTLVGQAVATRTEPPPALDDERQAAFIAEAAASAPQFRTELIPPPEQGAS